MGKLILAVCCICFAAGVAGAAPGETRFLDGNQISKLGPRVNLEIGVVAIAIGCTVALLAATACGRTSRKPTRSSARQQYTSRPRVRCRSRSFPALSRVAASR